MDQAAQVAERDNRENRARRERWKTKDCRLIPYSVLGDDHLLNILGLLRREAVLKIAVETVETVERMSRREPRGDAARDAVEAAFSDHLEKCWRSHTPPEWPGLMLEALRRPTIAAAAQRIRGEDLREAQFAVELMLLREVNV